MTRVALTYERLCRIVLMVFVVNVAMLVHTLMGLIVGGFFPSIAAAYATFRTWLIDEDQSWRIRQTWTVFHRAWKDELTQANLFGWVQLLIGLALAWDYYLVNWNDLGGVIGVGVSGLLLLLNLVFWTVAALSWSVRANFDEPLTWILRMSANMMLARPLCTLLLLAFTVIIGWTWSQWPGVFMVFGAAVPIFAVQAVIYSFGGLPGMSVKDRPSPNPADEAVAERGGLAA